VAGPASFATARAEPFALLDEEKTVSDEGTDVKDAVIDAKSVAAGSVLAAASLGAALFSGSQTAKELELSREEAEGLKSNLAEVKRHLEAEQGYLKDTRAELESISAQLKQTTAKLHATIAEKSAGDAKASDAISVGKKRIEALDKELRGTKALLAIWPF
jgi:septal ring factor EnvC (AmiA/AmiB activator)